MRDRLRSSPSRRASGPGPAPNALRRPYHGLLTIRDQTKPVALIVKAAPREGGIWVEGSGQIRLSDFGLKPPRAVAGVGLFIGTKDEMTVQFALLASPTDK